MDRSRISLLGVLPFIGLGGCDIGPKDDLVTSTGVVNKGILSNAIAQAYRADTKELLKNVYTKIDGTFSLDEINFDGTLYVEVRTTSQTLATCDGASGCGNYPNGLKQPAEQDHNLNGMIDFGDKYFFHDPNFVLKAFIRPANKNETRLGNFSVTPLTHLAAEKISSFGFLDPEKVSVVNAQVAELFGLDGADITRVIPPDITSADAMSNADQTQQVYAALNAAVASLAGTKQISISNVINTLATTFKENNGLVGNSNDTSKITLLNIQSLAQDVATVVEDKLDVSLADIKDKIQQEVTEQQNKPPDEVVMPSEQPALEADYDNDGLSDEAETEVHNTNPFNPDTDSDGMYDGWEVQYLDPLNPDMNNNGVPDGDEDFDNDGLVNIYEFHLNTNPNSADTDGDGISDANEDFDGDGLSNQAELFTHNTNPLSEDTDGDGLKDGDEIALGTIPYLGDTDADGLMDGWEVTYGLDPTNNDSDSDEIPDGSEDFDGDGLINIYEQWLGSNPSVANTGDLAATGDIDGDGINNIDELNLGLNPFFNDALLDNDGDGINNLLEVSKGSDPHIPNPTIEFISDASLYANASSGTLEMSIDEKHILVSSNDVSDLNFFDDVSGGVTTDDNSNQDVLFHNVSVNKYGLPIRQDADGTSLLAGWSTLQSMSPDGLKILFSSTAPDDQVSGNTDIAFTDLYVYDRILNKSKRVGTNAQLDNSVYTGKISAKGDSVVMAADATNFVANDTNTNRDIFTFDLSNDTAKLISRNYTSTDSANGLSDNPSMSSDGQRIVFSSGASNILDNAVSDTNGSTDIYFYDGISNSYKRVSITKNAIDDTSTPPSADYAKISKNGRGIIYFTTKDILDSPAGVPTYQQMYYVDVDRMLAGDSIEQYTTLITKSWDGSNGGYGDGFTDTMNVHISADGKHVFYKSQSQNITFNDSNAASLHDLFIWDKSQNQNYLLSQYVYGLDGSDLKFDGTPSSHTNGMGVQSFLVSADDASIYAILDHGHEYTDIPTSATDGVGTNCTLSSNYCLYKINLFMPQFDFDNDGLSDRAEETAFTISNNPDTDNDSLLDGLEVYQYDTSPIHPDTDGDGSNDGIEVGNGTDPLDPTDF